MAACGHGGSLFSMVWGLIRLGDLLVKSAEANGEVLTDKGRERIVGRAY